MSLEKIASLPKTIYYNLKIFGWGGVKLPIIFSHRVIIHGIRRGCIEIKNLQKNRIYIGFGGTIGVEPNKNTVLSFGPSAVLIINGTAQIAAGSVFRIDAGAIRLGESFSCNRNCFISCSKEITFGTINEQISNFAQTYLKNLKASSNEALLFMRRYRFANCSCFSCCFKDAYPSSNVQ